MLKKLEEKLGIKLKLMNKELSLYGDNYTFVCLDPSKFYIIKEYIDILNGLKNVKKIGELDSIVGCREIKKRIEMDKINDYEIIEETPYYIVYNDTSNLKGV